MRSQLAAKFMPGQSVTLHFTGSHDEPFTEDAIVIRNCDHVSAPLTDVWSVRVVLAGGLGRQFGFSGSHMTARADA